MGNPHVLDDWHRDVAPRRATASKTYFEISSASESPPHTTKSLPLRESVRAAASSLKPPLPKRKSLRSSSGTRTSQDHSATMNSPAAGARISPRSPSKRAYGDFSSEPHDEALTANTRVSKNRAQGNDHDMEGVQEPPAGRRTRTRRDSLDGTDSQKSFDRSIGSTSPLLVRLKEQRGRPRTSTSNPPQAPATPPKKEKARQEVLDEDQPLDQESLAMIDNFLADLERVTLDDHATAVRWTLHDTRRAVGNTKPICVDVKSPFESLTSIRLAPGAELPEGAVIVNMESVVRIYPDPTIWVPC